MPALDILNNDIFNPIPMTRAMRRVPFVPEFLGGLNLFTREPIRDTRVELRRIEGRVRLIRTTERGGPPVIGMSEDAKAVYLKTPRLAKRQRLQAHSIQNARSIDGTNDLLTMQDEVMRIQAQLRQDMEHTWEYHRWGAMNGILLDADGTTVLANFFDLWGITQPALIDMRLDEPTVDPRLVTAQIVRDMMVAGKGTITPASRILALCGNNFYDSLVTHALVRETYRYQDGSSLRNGLAYGSFDFGGITWLNFRGMDDGSALTIPTNECRFIPTNAPEVFGVALSPFESADFVNTLGEDVYAIMVRDTERNFWAQPEIYSYPLHFCRVPEVLFRAVRF